MTNGIRNNRYFCQKIASVGVGRTCGGDIDNFYFGYYGDRLVIWEAKHVNASRDYNTPQTFYLKKLVDNLINLEVALVWVEHNSEEEVVYLKDTTPVKYYYKRKGSAKGELYDPEEGITVHDFAAWADKR